MLLAILSIGGILGTLGRYYLSRTIQNAGLIQRVFGYHFPLGIFCVNILGCFFAGIVYALEEIEPYPLVLFLFTGILGAFTTFSTYILETMGLFLEGRRDLAIANLLLTLFLSIIAATLGIYVANLF